MPNESLADQVFAWLTDQLVTGNLRPGQWVSENELAALLGVSRSPVREALRSLAREGLVEVRPRRGTVIAALDARDADDLYRTRQLVEAELTRLAVENASDDDVNELTRIVDDLRAGLGNPPAFYEATVRLWQLLMDACPNRILSDLVAMLWRRSIRYRGLLLVGVSEPQQDVLTFAERLVDLARTHDGQGAHDEMALTLDQLRRRLLEQVFINIGDGNPPLPRPVAHAPQPRRSTRNTVP